MRNRLQFTPASHRTGRMLATGASAIAFAAALMANPAMAAPCGTTQDVSAPCEAPVTPASGTFQNSSTITTTNAPTTILVGSGINISTFTNTTTGTINGTTSSVTGNALAVDGTITTLNNSGLIYSGDASILVNATGTIGTINNAAESTIGSIAASSAHGINVAGGSISTINNAGSIEAEDLGAISATLGGTIGTINNSGTMEGGALGAGINNDGSSVGTINNTTLGSIGGANNGVLNQNGGSITTITNDGLIASNVVAVRNLGSTIGTLDNGGTIIGNGMGIYAVGGTINILDNTGSITGATAISLNSNATVGTLDNRGEINGSQGNGIYIASSTVNGINNQIEGMIFGDDSGISNDGTVNTINNVGGIQSNGIGIRSNGAIGTVNNSGSISSFFTGLSSYTGINVLNNTGSISSTEASGIYNGSGTISLIENVVGAEISGGSAGIYNSDLIESLVNDGTISSGQWAVYNASQIGSVENNGTIGGFNVGINNNTDASINTIVNTGSILSTEYGILNKGGTITSLDNSGAIGNLGPAGSLETTNAGVSNDGGTITTVNNSGSIQGLSGLRVMGGGTMGTLTNSGLIQGINYYGVAVLSGTLDKLVNTETGEIIGNTPAVYNSGTIGTVENRGIIESVSFGLQNSGTIGTLDNSGAISGFYTAVSSYGGITTLNNTGTIRGENYTGFYNASGTTGTLENAAGAEIYGATAGVYNSDIINTLTNNGSILSGSYGVYNSEQIGTLTNTGAIHSTGSQGIYNSGNIDTIVNSGSITGEASNGIYNSGGTIGTLVNLGSITGGSVGISNTGTLATLTNAQGGLAAGGSLPALTYSGNLPTGEYLAHITSRSHYAQLTYLDGEGVLTSFNLTPNSVLEEGTYEDVLTGISSVNGALTGTRGRLEWMLLADAATAGNWDLVVALLGPDAVNTLLELGHSRDEVLMALRNRAALMNNALATDCSAFGSSGICLNFDVRRTALDQERETSGTFAASVSLTPQIRLGAFAEVPLSHATNLHGVERTDKKAIFGGFLGYSQGEHGAGLQVRVAGATHSGDVVIARPFDLEETEGGEGHSKVESWAIGAELGYGLKLGAHSQLMPYLGLQRLSVKRLGYTEATSAEVEYPLTYADYGQATTTGRAGAVLTGKLGEKVHYKIAGGVEFDLKSRSDAFAGTSTIDELDTFSLANTAKAKKFRGNGAVELGYEVLPGLSLGVSGAIRGEAFSGKTYSSLSAGLRFGL